MKYKELVKKSREEYQLDNNTINYLIKNYLKLDNYASITNVEISEDIVKGYFDKLSMLQKGLPLQYIIGNVDFYGYNYQVKGGVLIPRFETEMLVHYTKEYINKYFKGSASLVDIGTGSGAIGITLKKEIPSLEVTLTDISPIALKIATSNASNLDVDVTIYISDMLEEVINRNEKYDILISNPPYLTKNEEIMDIVKNNEPSLALYGGDDGLKYYKIILANAKKILNDHAIIAFEIGASQASDIIKIAHEYFNDSPYEIKKDLEGRDRMFFLFYNLYD
jgi:release factor glutamine methyltransferase